MAVTLKDVSVQCGVGITTASKVLNGKYVRCTDAVRKRILEVADRLEYKPNLLAKSLVTGRSNNIFLIVQGLGLNFTAVEQECYSRGYSLFTISSHHNKKHIDDTIAYARQMYVDGLLLMNPQPDSDTLAKAYEEGYPLVLLEDDRRLYPKIDMFGTDLEGAVRLAVDHLYELGHRRIAIFLPDSDFSAAYLRRDAWRHCLAEKKIPVKDEWLICFENTVLAAGLDLYKVSYEAALEFTRCFRKDSPDRPTAIILMVDSFAAPVERAFISCGWRVPEDISLVSTMSESVGPYSEVPVTTVKLDQVEVRMNALRHLLQKISGDIETDLPVRYFAKPSLVVRNSTARPAV